MKSGKSKSEVFAVIKDQKGKKREVNFKNVVGTRKEIKKDEEKKKE